MSRFKQLVIEAKVISKGKKWDNHLGSYLELVFENGDSKRVFEDRLLTIYYDEEGRPHRIGGPAYEAKGYEAWYLHGLRHRVGGPAETSYRLGGVVEFRWYLNGKLHRIDGPAVIEKSKSNSYTYSYFVNGRKFTEEEFYRHFGG